MIKYFIIGGIVGMIIKIVITDMSDETNIMISANRKSLEEIKEVMNMKGNEE